MRSRKNRTGRQLASWTSALLGALFVVGFASSSAAQTCATSCDGLRSAVSSYCAALGGALDSNGWSCATDAQGNGGGGGACRSATGVYLGSYGGSVKPVCPVCGNGRVESPEGCDDGNTTSGDGCTAMCVLEPPVCGNRRVESGEQCDDGNRLAGDGCDASCRREPTGDVGILKGNFGCPSISKGEVSIHIDNEDGGNAHTAGWTGATASLSANNIKYVFCKVAGSHFADHLGRFAVLSLGDRCPSGSLVYKRWFDTEDSDPANSYSGNITPNVVGANNALFHFCVFPGNAASTTFPRLGAEYGVFGTAPGTANFIHSDDEDHNNANYYERPNGVRTRPSDYTTIMTDEANTRLFVIRVPG